MITPYIEEIDFQIKTLSEICQISIYLDLPY